MAGATAIKCCRASRIPVSVSQIPPHPSSITVRCHNRSSRLGRSSSCSDAVFAFSLYPVAALLAILFPQRRNVFFALVLLSDQALEPLILRLQLVDAAFEGSYFVAHLLGGLLESLLTLLLLDAEASTGGCVAAALVLLGGETGGLLEVRSTRCIRLALLSSLGILLGGAAVWRRGHGRAGSVQRRSGGP